MSHDLSRWIENAEARRFTDEVTFERGGRLTEAQHFHLGDQIVHLTSQLRHGVSRELLASIGSHAIAFVRRKPEHGAR
jgi:hypothetical protein